MMRLEASFHSLRHAALKNSDFSMSKVSGTVNVAACSGWSSLITIVRVSVKSAELMRMLVRESEDVREHA